MKFGKGNTLLKMIHSVRITPADITNRMRLDRVLNTQFLNMLLDDADSIGIKTIKNNPRQQLRRRGSEGISNWLVTLLLSPFRRVLFVP